MVLKSSAAVKIMLDPRVYDAWLQKIQTLRFYGSDTLTKQQTDLVGDLVIRLLASSSGKKDPPKEIRKTSASCSISVVLFFKTFTIRDVEEGYVLCKMAAPHYSFMYHVTWMLKPDMPG